MVDSFGWRVYPQQLVEFSSTGYLLNGQGWQLNAGPALCLIGVCLYPQPRFCLMQICCRHGLMQYTFKDRTGSIGRQAAGAGWQTNKRLVFVLVHLLFLLACLFFPFLMSSCVMWTHLRRNMCYGGVCLSSDQSENGDEKGQGMFLAVVGVEVLRCAIILRSFPPPVASPTTKIGSSR